MLPIPKGWRRLNPATPLYVVAHARHQRRHGRQPSVPYRGIINPRRALAQAIFDLPVQVTTFCEWKLIDLDSPDGHGSLEPGTYFLERIPHPEGLRRVTWLVLPGTRKGMAEGAWNDWRNGELNTRGEPIDWEENEIRTGYYYAAWGDVKGIVKSLVA